MKIIIMILISTVIYAMEFSSLGSRTFSMGNAGVANSKTNLAHHYNPALLAKKTFGLYIGGSAEAGTNFDKTSLSEDNAQSLNNISNRYAKISIQPIIAVNIMSLSLAVSRRVGLSINTPTLPDANLDKSIAGILQLSKTIASAKIKSKMLMLDKISMSYGHTVKSAIGDVSVGTTINVLNGAFSKKEYGLSRIDDIANDFSTFSKNAKQQMTAGLDIGLLYSPLKGLDVAIVAKNINSPSIYGENFPLMLRAGVAYKLYSFINVALDADITRNTTFSNKPSQFIGGGADVSLGKFASLRVGALQNIATMNSPIVLTAGVNMAIFDVAIQYTSKNDMKVSFSIIKN